MKTLKEEILNKEPESQWIRIHNKRFKLEDVYTYSMVQHNADPIKRSLDITLYNGKEIGIDFRPDKDNEWEKSTQAIGKLDDYFKPKNYNAKDSTYF